jgi:uncharacterized protein YukE
MSDVGPGSNDVLEVHGEELTVLVGKLRVASEALDRLHTQADSAGGMVAASWGGQAGTSAVSLQGRATGTVRELRESISAIAEILEMSINDFDEQEQERVRELSAVNTSFEEGPATSVPGF